MILNQQTTRLAWHRARARARARAWIKAIIYDSFQWWSFRLPVPRSCSHAKSLGYRESKIYTIDVDGREENIPPFQVFCDMRDKDGVGVTVVSHDSENRTLVSGCEKPGCYRRDVHYDGISDVIAQLGALARESAHCEQYIKYECHGSMISKWRPIRILRGEGVGRFWKKISCTPNTWKTILAR